MEENYDVGGASVIYTDKKPKPHNPLNRPKVRYKKMLVFLALYLCSSVSLSAIAYHYTKMYFLLILGVWTVLFLAAISKKAIIWCIHLYQAKAPDKIRLRCVFEPSCSEYMILAIEKYGVIKGVVKGINRLHRCGFPNGGEDYP